MNEGYVILKILIFVCFDNASNSKAFVAHSAEEYSLTSAFVADVHGEVLTGARNVVNGDYDIETPLIRPSETPTPWNEEYDAEPFATREIFDVMADVKNYFSKKNIYSIFFLQWILLIQF